MTTAEIQKQFNAVLDEAKQTIEKARKEGRELTLAEQNANVDRFHRLEQMKLDMQAAKAKAGDQLPDEVINFAKGNFHNPQAAQFDRPADENHVLFKGDSALKKLRPQSSGIGIGQFLRATVLGAQNEREQFAIVRAGDSTGGYQLPPDLSASVLDGIRLFSTYADAGAGFLPLTDGRMRVAQQVAEPDAAFRVESAPGAPSPVPTTNVFQGVQLSPKTVAVAVKMSRELLEDAVNVNEVVAEAMNRAIAHEVDRVIGFGTGGAEPTGIFSATGINTVAATGANGDPMDSYERLLDGIFALQSLGHTPNAAIMSPREARTIYGLTDSTGQPLRLPAVLEKMLLLTDVNAPINQVKGTSNNASSMIVGDFRKLLVAIRSPIRIEVLREAANVTDVNLEYGFLAWLRMDVAVTNAKAFAKITGIVPA